MYSTFNIQQLLNQKKERTKMIRANSQKEQATILNLTEAEIESIRGGMGHHGDYDQSTYWSGAHERFSYRGDDRFGFRGSERNSYRSNGQSC
jgi:hypothetical protein